jgi:hypothetical protein
LKRLAVTKKNQDCLRFLKGTEEYFETLQYSETLIIHIIIWFYFIIDVFIKHIIISLI